LNQTINQTHFIAQHETSNANFNKENNGLNTDALYTSVHLTV